MPGSWRIGRLAGLDIYINYSWIIALALFTFSFANSWLPALYKGASSGAYLLLGFFTAILLFISVLLHELAHSLVARARGLPVRNIVLFIFGGVSNIEQEPQSAGVEFQMAFVGPLVSLLIGGLCYVLWLPLVSRPSLFSAMLIVLAIMNLLLGVFNLIPGFPLDGGRIFRSIVWKITGNAQQATQAATISGQIIAYIFILLGIFVLFSGDIIDGIWLGFIGWFLLSAAQSTRARATFDTLFKGVTVEELMNANPSTVPANISLQKLVDDYLLPQGLRSAFVMQGDQFAGLITLSDVRHVPREEWAQTLVGLSMIPLERLHTVSPGQPLSEVVPLMNSQDVNQLPVVKDGRLVGVLSRDAILRSLEVRRRLNLHKAV